MMILAAVLVGLLVAFSFGLQFDVLGNHKRGYERHLLSGRLSPSKFNIDDGVPSYPNCTTTRCWEAYATSRQQAAWIAAAAATTGSWSAATATASSVHTTVGKNHQSRYAKVVADPHTYSAVVYAPPLTAATPTGQPLRRRLPLLVILHGAGTNDRDVWTELTDAGGEHAGLAPSLLANNVAPAVLADNFITVAPHVGESKRSFYEEPRSKLLQFVDWICSPAGQQLILGDESMVTIDCSRIFLFGFSDGATVTMELATTRRFRAIAIAAYGYLGRALPDRALSLLRDIPVWVFHSADDVIFPVAYSDRLVRSLRSVSTTRDRIRYTCYDHDQEGFSGSVRGHSTGITASKLPELYEWMLSIP